MSLAGKIVITCVFACAAFFLSLYISKVTFGKILSTVDQLAQPDTKIQLVNALFQDVVKLDHLQRRQALKTEHTVYNPFLKESEHLQGLLDSLRGMSLQNTMQMARIDSMKTILYKRDLLFLRYIRLRTDLIKNDTLAVQVKNLSEMIEKSRSGLDSNRVTTSKVTRTIIDTVKQEEERKSLWNRIFARRKPKVQQVQKQVQEELKVRVDTVGLGSKGDSLKNLGQAISQVETNRISRRSILLGKQEELNRTGDILVSQLISILDDIQRDELAHDAAQNTNANHVVNKGIRDISAVLIIFITGIAILILLIFSDISRSNRYRRELIVAKELAEEAGLVKQRFLANMSHELRTPLQTIIGISEQIKTTQPRKQDIENIHHSSLHLLQIVNEVLDYSRIISGKYVLENKPFNMHSLLGEVKEMIQVQLALKNLELVYDIDVAAGSYYSGDAFRLKQVLLNLLGNAVKFTDKGSVSLSVSEKKHPGNNSTFTFIVKDTGIGISGEDINVIFNEFEQGDNRKRPGTGLGLSIVKAMVDIHDGTIRVESEPGKGTTFIMTLPYTTTDAVTEAPVTPADISNYKGHIWVVDDDAFILELCNTILNKYSISHTCFLSARKVLDTSFPENISIVFLDIRMAEMSGIALNALLKERTVKHQPEYIALTAQAFPDEQELILQQGFDSLIIKPFLEQHFISAIAGNTPAVVNDNTAIVDLSAILKMAGDDSALLERVLQRYIGETQNDVTKAKECIINSDAAGLSDILHRLAGRCGQLGAAGTALSLRSMEIALHEQVSISEATYCAEEIFEEINAMVTSLQNVLPGRNIPTDC